MEDKTLYIFDFDGVIVDTLKQCMLINRQYNPDLTELEFKELFMGNIFISLKEAARVPEPDGFNFQDIFKPILLSLSPYNGAYNFLQSLDRKDNLIISSTRSDSIDDFLHKHNLRSYFSEIWGQDVEKSKAKKLDNAIKKYKQYNSFVFITDTVGDIIEAKEHDIYTIAVTWGYHERARLEQAKPNSIVSTFDELLELVS